VALVSPVTGRIHANYRVAADTTGRAACSYPNIPSCAEEQAVSRAVSGGRRL
jgi:DNA polymerase I-like protein with 3'-5' exonuclease and polymerase domains